ncbi:ABC transporter ATP-binding protein [Pseudoruegeria sp. HB172150]|uniref:ABC transporter ATP-binding protein n=1 Tax=Pseudoruegeria sp. HB172150 TaxID=2721164 RepID=UPI00155375A4|nr:sn-glycerol-3-phosphate ABC transporter ATP-binding protein UgpC [Pseudoruegeria sp. HB172150]
MATVSLNTVGKTYGEGVQAVTNFDLKIRDEEFVVLVGPSGCGKSTTLRMVAGLEEITSGDLLIDEKRVNDLAPAERDIAMVFQNYALYPHMTVEDNISFGLKQQRMPKSEIKTRVADAARILGLEPLLARKPRALSGGQRQRVAMGRAIVRHPKVFLFDEPLSNLDAKLRVQMRAEIKHLHQKIPTTTIYVTHDQIEAMTMADRVVVMSNGKIEQVGPPQELYNHPDTLFVASFIGSPAMNLFPVTVDRGDGGLQARLENGTVVTLPADRQATYGAAVGKKMLLGLRPEAIGEAGAYGYGDLTTEIDYLEPLGAETLVFFPVGEVNACAKMPAGFTGHHGDKVTFSLDLSRMHLIDPETEKVLKPGR